MSGLKEIKMEGKTVIITGANRGLGRETAFQLATRGTKVIMACRNVTMAKDVRKQLVEETGNRNIFVKKLDLASLNSVRSFAREILATEDRLDVLICNAAAVSSKKVLTEDGFESTFQIDYLGHFLLVMLLLPLIKKSQPSRVIMLTSLLFVFGSMDLNCDNSYYAIKSYGTAKLALVLFVQELDRRLRGTEVRINAVHPGLIMTDLVKQSPRWFSFITGLFRWFISDVKTGADTTVYLAVSEDVANESGNLYYWRMKIPITPYARDMARAKELWERSCEFVGLNVDTRDLSVDYK